MVSCSTYYFETLHICIFIVAIVPLPSPRNESRTPVINGNGGESGSRTSIPVSGVNEEIMNFHLLFFLKFKKKEGLLGLRG